jgi:hypothetical protein
MKVPPRQGAFPCWNTDSNSNLFCWDILHHKIVDTGFHNNRTGRDVFIMDLTPDFLKAPATFE